VLKREPGRQRRNGLLRPLPVHRFGRVVLLDQGSNDFLRDAQVVSVLDQFVLSSDGKYWWSLNVSQYDFIVHHPPGLSLTTSARPADIFKCPRRLGACTSLTSTGAAWIFGSVRARFPPLRNIGVAGGCSPWRLGRQRGWNSPAQTWGHGCRRPGLQPRRDGRRQVQPLLVPARDGDFLSDKMVSGTSNAPEEATAATPVPTQRECDFIRPTFSGCWLRLCASLRSDGATFWLTPSTSTRRVAALFMQPACPSNLH